MISCDTNSLLDASRCFRCIPPGMRPAVNTYLMAEWANKPTCPAEALTFLAAAGISVASTEGQAVCSLVSDLQAYPAANPAGSKYWDKDLAIYPLVGTTAAQHAVNLKTPGTSNMTFHVAVVHSAFGIQGNGSTAYANTNYTLALTTNARVMVYVHQYPSGGGDNKFVFGARVGTVRTMAKCDMTTSPLVAFLYDINNTQVSYPSDNGAGALGAWFIQRISNATNQSGILTNALKNQASAFNSAPAQPMYLLAMNDGGSPILHSNPILSSFSMGTLLTAAERLEYKSIWDTFNTALGRGHP